MRKICLALLSALSLFLPMTESSKAFPLEELTLFINRPSTTIRLEKDGSFTVPTDTEKGFGISYSVENFPVIPDVRVEYTHLHTTGSTLLKEDLTISDYTVAKGTEVGTKIDGNNIKLTLYYQPLDRFNYDFINLELGINLFFIDYKVKTSFNYSGNTAETEDDLSTVVPSLHVKVSCSPTYYLSLFLRGAVPFSDRRVHKEIEGGVKYFLNSQLYLFGSYAYSLSKADDVDGYDLKATSRVFSLGVGLIW